MDRYINEHDFSEGDQIVVKNGCRNINIAAKEIVFVESSDKYIYINLTNGSVIKCRMKMSDLMAMLPQPYFLHCHQSYLINMHYVMNIDNDTFVTRTGNRIPIRKKELNKIIGLYMDYVAARH